MATRRKSLARHVAARILEQCRRRCALCFYLKGDLTEKIGQLAHLDGDPGNAAESNVAFLCMDHHSVYDSTTSQHKNYTPAEIRTAKDILYEAIRNGGHLHNSIFTGRETDAKTLSDIIEMLSASETMHFIKDACFAGWSFSWTEVDGLERFLRGRDGVEHEFIDPELEELRLALRSASENFLGSLAAKTSPTRHVPSQRAVPQALEGDDPARFHQTVTVLRAAADQVCACYDRLVRTARAKLST
jgi:hypothetical protein